MSSDERIWQRWIDWLPTAPRFEAPAPAIAHYRDSLTAAGATVEAAEHEVGVILRLMRSRTDGWRVLFNNLYSNPSPGFSTEPSPLLASAVAGRGPGRALDLATGQGRNAVHLAVHGWSVTAIDVSDEGLRLTAASAERQGVRVETVLAAADTFDYGIAAWDLVVITYAPVPVTDPAFVRVLERALRPSGLVVIESFASDAGDSRRRPVDIDPSDLEKAFEPFRIVRFDDEVDVPEWDPVPTRLVRLVAEKG